MADADTAWVMYAADYDTGRQHSRIIPESVRVLRASTREISSDELQAERERTGLDNRLHTIQIDVPPEVASANLAAYAERYISLEPGFDFWDDVIGDDIVVAGIAYDGDLYAPDGEGGVRPLTEAEQAARDATIRQREAEREAEQTAREAERRRQAIDYATTSAATGNPRTAVSIDRPHAAVLRELEDNPAIRAGLAHYAIDRFLDHRRGGLDVEEALQQAAIDAASEYATAWRTIESGVPAAAAGTTAHTELDGAEDEVIVLDPRDVLPALPALRGFRLAEDAVGRFVDNREAGLDVLAARQRAATVHADAGQTAPEAGPHDNAAEQAATSADTAGTHTASHVSDLRERSANLRSGLLLAVEHPGVSPTGHRPEQIRQPTAEQSAGTNREAEWELDLALADAPADVRDAYWRSRDVARDEQEPDIGP